jgi:hypothetical protein
MAQRNTFEQLLPPLSKLLDQYEWEQVLSDRFKTGCDLVMAAECVVEAIEKALLDATDYVGCLPIPSNVLDDPEKMLKVMAASPTFYEEIDEAEERKQDVSDRVVSFRLLAVSFRIEGNERDEEWRRKLVNATIDPAGLAKLARYLADRKVGLPD